MGVMTLLPATLLHSMELLLTIKQKAVQPQTASPTVKLTVRQTVEQTAEETVFLQREEIMTILFNLQWPMLLPKLLS